MYRIHEARDGTCVCEVRIQDGTERFPAPNREEAIFKVISAARVLNGSYIQRGDIEIIVLAEPTKEEGCCENCRPFKVVLDRIRRGEIKLVEAINPLIKFGITADECDLIIKLREGEFVTVPRRPPDDLKAPSPCAGCGTG